jgi:hypothetical protein
MLFLFNRKNICFLSFLLLLFVILYFLNDHDYYKLHYISYNLYHTSFTQYFTAILLEFYYFKYTIDLI